MEEETLSQQCRIVVASWSIEDLYVNPFESCWTVIKLSGIKIFLYYVNLVWLIVVFLLQKAGVAASSFYFRIIKFLALMNEELSLEINLHFPAAIIEARREVQLFPQFFVFSYRLESNYLHSAEMLPLQRTSVKNICSKERLAFLLSNCSTVASSCFQC